MWNTNNYVPKNLLVLQTLCVSKWKQLHVATTLICLHPPRYWGPGRAGCLKLFNVSKPGYTNQPVNIISKDVWTIEIQGEWGKQVQRVPRQCLVHSGKCNGKSDLLQGDPQTKYGIKYLKPKTCEEHKYLKWRLPGVGEGSGHLPGLCWCLAGASFSIIGFNPQFQTYCLLLFQYHLFAL